MCHLSPGRVLQTAYAGKLIRREQADRRGGGKVQVFSELPAQDESSSPQAQAAGSEPDPAEAAAMAETCERLLARLEDEELTRVAVWKLEGFSNADIADKLNPLGRHGRAQAATDPRHVGERERLSAGPVACRSYSFRSRSPSTPFESNAGAVLAGFPRVTDFRLARLEVAPRERSARHTS